MPRRQHSFTAPRSAASILLDVFGAYRSDKADRTAAVCGCSHTSLRRIDNAAKADSSRSIVPGGHQEILLVFIQPVCLREIPNGTTRLISRTPTKNRGSRM